MDFYKRMGTPECFGRFINRESLQSLRAISAEMFHIAVHLNHSETHSVKFFTLSSGLFRKLLEISCSNFQRFFYFAETSNFAKIQHFPIWY